MKNQDVTKIIDKDLKTRKPNIWAQRRAFVRPSSLVQANEPCFTPHDQTFNCAGRLSATTIYLQRREAIACLLLIIRSPKGN